VFIVGHSGGLVGHSAAVLFEPASSGGDTAPGGAEGEDVAGTLGRRPQGYSRESTELDGHGAYIPETAYALAARNAKGISQLEGQNNLVTAIRESHPGEISTGNGRGSHGIQDASAVRRLTPTECERLQGFPDGWTHGKDGPRYAALGDAVTVNVAEWIGKRMVMVSD